MSMIQDSDLADVLSTASADDLGLLIDVITDSGNGRISLSSSVCRQLSEAKNTKITEYERGLIAEELSRFGGNSLMNIFRGGSGVPYKELLGDVASHVGVGKGSDCAKLELAIIGKVVEQSMARMSEEDKAAFFDSLGGCYRPGMGPGALATLLASLSAAGTYQLSAAVAGATMTSLVGRGVVFAGAGGMGKGFAVLAGPVGWAITGIWTAFDLASPAYRVTVPCVIQIGYMRQKMLVANACPACAQPVDTGNRYCPGCGANLQSGA